MAEYFEHSAESPDGKSDPVKGRWQRLGTHLDNVANLAKQLIKPATVNEKAQLPGVFSDFRSGVLKAGTPT